MSDKIFDPSELDLDFDSDLTKQKPKKTSNSSSSSSIKKDDDISVSNGKMEIKKIEEIKEEKIEEKIEEVNEKKEKLENKVENSGLPSLEDDKEKKETIKKVISADVLRQTLTDKSLLPEEMRKKIEAEKETKRILQKEKEMNHSEENKIIFDVNISKITDLTKILIEKNYDFFTLEPTDTYSKITFFHNNIIKEIKYIKLPEYFGITTEAKSIAKLKTNTTHLEQKGTGKINIKDNNYDFITKIVPGNHGEKVFVKLIKTAKKVVAKKAKKMSMAKAFTFLAIILFIVVLIGAMFLGFVVFNSNSVSDLKFFKNLGIDTGGIQKFVANLVNIIFIIILFIESIFLASFIFKAFLAKKDKGRRIAFSMLSILFMIIVFVSGGVWMTLAQKINALKSDTYGIIVAYNNNLLKINKQVTEPIFSKDETIIYNGKNIKQNSNLVGPITIRYEIDDFLQEKRGRGGDFSKVNSIIWKFGDGAKVVRPVANKNNFATFKYDKKKLYQGKIIVKGTDLKGETLEIPYDLPAIDISYIVDINSKRLKTGGKQMSFDSSDLKPLGKTTWYLIDGFEGKPKDKINSIFSEAFKNPILTKYKFIPNKAISEETIIGMDIEGNRKGIDKYFIVEKDEKSNISGSIEMQADINNDRKYTFYVKNPQTAKGNGGIKDFIWEIDGDRTPIKADFENQEKSSKITHTFRDYGPKIIKVILIDADDLEQTLTKRIILKEKPQLKTKLNILDYKGNKIKTVKYDKKMNTYSIKRFQVPTKIILDAIDVENENSLYEVEKIDFDLNGDGDFEKIGIRKMPVELPTERKYKFQVKYTFRHIKDHNKKRELIEYINIDAEKKEADIKVKVKILDEYAPTDVIFDASDSWVKGITKEDLENIVEFAYDYGDDSPIVKTDAKTTHRYMEAGHYKVKVTVTTDKGKQFVNDEISVILKPGICKAIINASMYRNIPIGQEVNFDSKNSSCEIQSWYWEFGDGETSSRANPDHSYKKEGKYTVKLTIIFKNHNKKVTYKKVNVVR